MTSPNLSDHAALGHAFWRLISRPGQAWCRTCQLEVQDDTTTTRETP